MVLFACVVEIMTAVATTTLFVDSIDNDNDNNKKKNHLKFLTVQYTNCSYVFIRGEKNTRFIFVVAFNRSTRTQYQLNYRYIYIYIRTRAICRRYSLLTSGIRKSRTSNVNTIFRKDHLPVAGLGRFKSCV